jgi:GNAT superfamily N-acetyltransferase
MDTAIHYRRAQPADAEALAGLRFQFRSEIGETVEDEPGFTKRCAEWMRTRLTHDHWLAWIAEGEDQLLGQVWLQILEKIPNPVAEAEYNGYITNLFVRSDARGSGVGGALLRLALAYARNAGIDRIVLWPTERSRPLYTRLGFGEADDLMQLTLRP